MEKRRKHWKKEKTVETRGQQEEKGETQDEKREKQKEKRGQKR